jgi:GTP-binding protein EngB required for normal cell division
LAAIVERLETDTLEIAVFGRVSSGKSSLLNHIAGRSESTAKTGMAAIGRGLSLRGLA